MNQPKIAGWDSVTLAKTVWGEARGECYLGQIAVAWVIRNRATHGGWWGESVAEVCTKPFQFSCWNADDPNRHLLDHLTIDTPGYLRAIGIAALVLTGDLQDPTGGADHYCALNLSPKWAEGKDPSMTIGNHKFYELGSGA